MTYNEIIDKVAKKQNLPKRIIDKTYRAYWRAVMEYISSLPLKNNLRDEEFLNLRPNINIPSIGKLYITLEKYHRISNRQEEIKRKKLGESNNYNKLNNLNINKDVTHNED